MMYRLVGSALIILFGVGGYFMLQEENHDTISKPAVVSPAQSDDAFKSFKIN
jgi:hypothetical protein